MPRLYRTDSPDVLESARAFDRRDIPLVPMNGKAATEKAWQKPENRLSIDEIEEALTASRELGVGLILNQTPWIDIEHDKGEAGEAQLQELFGGDIPDTVSWKTERGIHRLFRRPEGMPNTAKLEIDGIEFRGLSTTKGATAALPPHEGREWILSFEDREPAELPEHIADMLRQKARPKKQRDKPADSDRIAEGSRNTELFKLGCHLRAVIGNDVKLLRESLLRINESRCEPPLDEEEVLAIVRSVREAEGDPKVGWLERLLGGVELWHDENGDPFATVSQGEHRENWKIGKRNKAWRRWIAQRFYKSTGEPVKDSTLSEICMTLEGMACFDGPQCRTFCRVGEHDGKIYLDLCDEQWRAVEIDTDGWRLISDPPVKFVRAKAMAPLPLPEPMREGEKLQGLLSPFLNLGLTGWPLIAGWLVAALRPIGPYPILKLSGEQGSAKTTTARALRKLVDPNSAPVRSEPRDTRDLMIAANNSRCLVFDNLSSVKIDLSDAICRMSTGGGFATRTLYTDEDETIFDAMRPQILTSIEDIGNRSDLLERSLLVDLPAIPESKRRAEKKYWAAFDEVHPRILGGLLDAVVVALQRLPEVESRDGAELSRLADFEQWVIAAEPALGLAPGQFVEAYRANQAAAHAIALESAPAMAALIEWLLRQVSPCEFTATELLSKLTAAFYSRSTQPGWPKTPRVLSQQLGRAAPNLRAIGIVAVQTHRSSGNTKEKVWRFTFEGVAPGSTEEAEPAKVRPAKTPKKRGAKRTGRTGSKSPEHSIAASALSDEARSAFDKLIGGA